MAVGILGHIFEQSITDLERLRDDLDTAAEADSIKKHKSRRKKEGAFYTPEFITRYIVGQALSGVLNERFERLRQRHADAATGTARSALTDPDAYDLEKLNQPQSLHGDRMIVLARQRRRFVQFRVNNFGSTT